MLLAGATRRQHKVCRELSWIKQPARGPTVNCVWLEKSLEEHHVEAYRVSRPARGPFDDDLVAARRGALGRRLARRWLERRCRVGGGRPGLGRRPPWGAPRGVGRAAGVGGRRGGPGARARTVIPRLLLVPLPP